MSDRGRGSSNSHLRFVESASPYGFKLQLMVAQLSLTTWDFSFIIFLDAFNRK